MGYQYDGDDEALRDWIDLIERRANRPSEYHHHPPKPWLAAATAARQKAIDAASDAYYAAYYSTDKDAYPAAEAAYRIEIARIDKEYPQ